MEKNKDYLDGYAAALCDLSYMIQMGQTRLVDRSDRQRQLLIWALSRICYSGRAGVDLLSAVESAIEDLQNEGAEIA